MRKLLLLIICTVLTVPAMAQKNVYKFTVKDGNERKVKLKEYKGKVLLIVNTATKCGFTPQYEELQKLYENYKDKGLLILDFPCNQFGGQAPGTYREIHAFCTGNYGVTLPTVCQNRRQRKERVAPLHLSESAASLQGASTRTTRLDNISTLSSAKKTQTMPRVPI